jgi:alkylation response protein AidB-like acyl-CoA dehydrogenase
MTWRPPVDDIVFTLTRIAGAAPGRGEPGAAIVEADVRAVLDEVGRLCAERVAPLDRDADRVGAAWHDGRVTTPAGFRDAYRAWCAGGWNGVALPEAWGGAGLPTLVGTAVMELLTGACMAFATLPVLTQAAAECLDAHADDALKARYLPPLVAGTWTASMNLTEPQAGSDLGLVRCRAEPIDGGRYRVTGSKVFITFGAHDLAETIVHLVLARLPEAPEGSRGLSLLLVPQRLPADDGGLGDDNAVHCVGIEKKLGLNGSPTCALRFEGAVGWLVGRPHHGLAAMFTMMNKARLATGLQGVAMAEKATQKAAAFALERRQGRAPEATGGGSAAGGSTSAAGRAGPVPIAAHPDVARTLARMKALTAAARALAYAAAAAIDAAAHDAGSAGAARAGFLTPVVKAFATEIGCEVASLGIQIHGGAGYIEETGAAQLWRDVRVAPIYEGTNAIQAIDLVTRKLPLDGGAEAAAIATLCRADIAAAADALGPAATARLGAAVAALERASRQLLDPAMPAPARLTVASDYLRLVGIAVGGALLARGAAGDDGDERGDDGGATAQAGRLARVFAEDVAGDAVGLAERIAAADRRLDDYRALAGLG